MHGGHSALYTHLRSLTGITYGPNWDRVFFLVPSEHLIVYYRQYHKPTVYTAKRAWQRKAFERMHDMGLPCHRIIETIEAMRKSQSSSSRLTQ